MMIRKLTREDAETLQDCRLFGLTESPGTFLVSHAEVRGTPLSQVEADLGNPDIHYVGAFDGGQLVGFMRYIRSERQSRRHTAEIRSVYVKKAVRGQGIGKSLLSQLIQDATDEEIESLILVVLADNAPARRLYESSGFKIYGNEPRAIKRNNHYIDQTLYWLNLSAT